MLTQKRDLRSGTSVWLAHRRPALGKSLGVAQFKPDVVVVGTGVSGALVADALLRAGMSVLAIDRRPLLTGSTVASTALLQSELDTPLLHLQKKLGAAAAARVSWRSAAAVQALADRVADLGLDCEFKARTSLYLPGNVLGVAGLKAEAAARAALGLRSNFLSRKELLDFSGIDRAGAIVTSGNAEADPVKLVAGLWRHFIAGGGRIAADMEVAGVDQSRHRVRLSLAGGGAIEAKHVVFCTGYELMNFAKPKGYKVISTWVLATRPQAAKLWRSKSLIWEAADPYLYLRTTADGRIIAGGADEPFSDDEKRDALIPQKIKAIARKAQRLFPEADFTPEYSWAGCFGESPTGLPAIGPVRGLPRCYAVLGFGGNGITFSMLAAQLVSRHIQGLKDPDAELFAL